MISEPFYFGQNRSCFGHYTPSQGLVQGKSVLIVPSVFGEAIRSYRVAREVTKSLARRGYDVLRFDFDGDGNSCSQMHNTSVQDWIKNIQDGYDELVTRSKAASVSVFAIRFGAGLSLIALKERSVESFVLWDPLLSNREMYDVFVGPSPTTKVCDDIQHTNNPFVVRPKRSGFFEVGLAKGFADAFLQLPDITIPACDVQIITTEPAKEQQEIFSMATVCEVNHQCDWPKKDLPLIFAPKLLSTVSGCF